MEWNSLNQHADCKTGRNEVFSRPPRLHFLLVQLEFRIIPASEFVTPGEVASVGMEGAEALIVVLDGTQVGDQGCRAARVSQLHFQQNARQCRAT